MKDSRPLLRLALSVGEDHLYIDENKIQLETCLD